MIVAGGSGEAEQERDVVASCRVWPATAIL